MITDELRCKILAVIKEEDRAKKLIAFLSSDKPYRIQQLDSTDYKYTNLESSEVVHDIYKEDREGADTLYVTYKIKEHQYFTYSYEELSSELKEEIIHFIWMRNR